MYTGDIFSVPFILSCLTCIIIVISGKNDQKHLDHLDEVLTRLESTGLRLKLSKCQFMQPTVEYLGYRIDAQGLHAIEKKVELIRNAPAPENQQQLR